MLLPTPEALGAFTVEDKTVRLQAPSGTVPEGGVSGWTVQHVISDGEGGTVLLRKTLGSGVTLISGDDGIWDVSYSKSDLGTTLGEGSYWHCFERTDIGYGLVISRGPFQVKAASE